MSVEPSYNGSFRSYSYNRHETEAAIRILCKRYPKCFFEDPHLRRPLENNIISDLEKDGAPLKYDLLVRAVEFYQTHFGYRYNILAGARKINLDGKEVSIVTESEFLNTQKKIREDKAKLRERNEANPITTARVLYQSGQIPDDQLKKIDALPMMKAPVKVAPKVIEPVKAAVPVKPTAAEAAQSNTGRDAETTHPQAQGRKKCITFQVPESLLQKIDRWAAQNELTRSEAARMFLELAVTVADNQTQ